MLSQLNKTKTIILLIVKQKQIKKMNELILQLKSKVW